MRKTHIAATVASMAALFGGFSTAAQAESLTYDGADTGKTAVSADKSGSASDSTLSISGGYQYGIASTSSDISLKDWSSIDITLQNPLKQGGVNGITAANGKTVSIQTGTLSISTSGQPSDVELQQSPVGIHAFGGTVSVDAADDIRIESESNAVMSQATAGNHSGLVNLKTKGDIIINAKPAAVLAGLLQNNLAKASSKVKMEAENISITSATNVAVEIYDNDSTWNPNDPRQGDASIDLKAAKKLSLNGLIGIYQLRNGAMSPVGSTSTFTAGESIDIKASSYGVIAKNGETSDAPNILNFAAPSVTIEGTASAAVAAQNGSSISFAGIDGGASNVTLKSSANALSIENTGSVSFANASVTAQGNEIGRAHV